MQRQIFNALFFNFLIGFCVEPYVMHSFEFARIKFYCEGKNVSLRPQRERLWNLTPSCSIEREQRSSVVPFPGHWMEEGS